MTRRDLFNLLLAAPVAAFADPTAASIFASIQRGANEIARGMPYNRRVTITYKPYLVHNPLPADWEELLNKHRKDIVPLEAA